MARLLSYLFALWLSFVHITTAIEVDWSNSNSIKAAARTTAETMLGYYHGNESGQIPGLLPGPPPGGLYYWWEAGAMFGALINYWHTTGDESYNPTIMQALQFQVGPYNDYMPPNESASLGNDDQAFWGMAALAAAEYNFPNPAASQPSWLSLAQAVFNEQVSRWDTSTCAGGIHWQIYQITGYDLKNSISNGCLFNIAARLARYTGDDMYAQWASKIWDWMWYVGLISPQYGVYDNSEATRLNCTQLDRNQWTYNAGTMIMGASAMYNYTNGDPVWKNRTASLIDNARISFFQEQYGGAMTDICEAANACDTDQKSFKAYLSRWLAAATHMAPFTYDTVYPLLMTSAKAAAAQCNGGASGVVCGLKWYLNGTWDGTDGVGQQMAALEVILSTLTPNTAPPVTNSTGGTSASNPTAGYNGTAALPGTPSPANRGDKIGAWFLTAVMIVLVTSVWWFMIGEGLEYRGAPPTVGGRRPRESRIWKGEAAMMKNNEKSQAGLANENGIVNEKGARASSVLKKNSVMMTPPAVAAPRISSISSVLLTDGKDPRGRSAVDRKSTPVYRGGELLT